MRVDAGSGLAPPLLVALLLAASSCGESGGVAPEGPALRIEEPTTLQFEVEQGRDVPTQITRITNAGGGTLNWVASASDPWLTARPASGTLAVGESQDLGISVLSDEVEPGEYAGTVRVSSSDDPTVSQTLSVRMTVASLLSEMEGTIVYASDRHDSSCDVTCPLDIYAMNADGSDVRRLTETAEEGVRSSTYPDLSADGERIVFLTSERGEASIRVMAADGSSLQTIFAPDASGNVETPSWSPDGRWVAFLSQHSGLLASYKDLWLVSADGREVVEVTQDLPWHHGLGLDWSPDGTRLLHPRDDDALWVVDVDGANATRLMDGPVFGPRWSPDASSIAFARRRDEGSGLQILVSGPGGADLTPLVQELAYSQVSLSWSPDGSRVVFQAYNGIQADLWSVRADGTGLIQITDTPYNEVLPSWGPRRDP